MSTILKYLLKTESEAESELVQDVQQGDSSRAMRDNLFETVEAKTKHESDTKQPPDKQPTVQCSKCWKRISKADMEAHQNCLLGLGPYKCERGCENMDFSSKQNRLYHYRNTHSGQQHECDICHKSFPSRSRLYCHKKDVHAPKTYVCPVCNKAFSTSLRLARHRKRHSERSFKCPQNCENIVFHCQLKRQQHYLDFHDRHECDICHNLFRSEKTLGAHKQNVHAPKTFGCSASLGLRPYKCERGCENVDFDNKQNQRYHHLNTHSGQHECDICHKSFQSNNKLYHHKKSVHIPKTHVCPVCSKAFKTSTNLARHSICRRVRERKHHCSLCTLSYFTKCELKMHIRTKHTKRKQTKNHSCPKCNKLFCYKYNVTRHLQRHDKVEERMRSMRSITVKDLVETKPEADSEQMQDELQGDSSTAMDEDLFEAEEAKIEPESDSEQSTELEDLFEAEEVKIEAREDPEQTIDIKTEPKDAASSSTHHWCCEEVESIKNHDIGLLKNVIVSNSISDFE